MICRGVNSKTLTVRTGASIVINKKSLDGDLFRVVKVLVNKFYDVDTTDGDISLIKVFVQKKIHLFLDRIDFNFVK